MTLWMCPLLGMTHMTHLVVFLFKFIRNSMYCLHTLSATLFTAADTSFNTLPTVEERVNMQIECMHNLINLERCRTNSMAFGDLDLGDADTVKEVCLWPGVYCEDRAQTSVTKILWMANRPKAFDSFFETAYCLLLEWLPPTLTRFAVQRAAIHFGLSVPHLPRKLRYLTAENCELVGSLVLRGLPPALITLQLSHNFFMGKIYLVALPKQIEFVDLRFNAITHAYVLNELLPRSLCEVVLYNGSEFSNKVSIRSLNRKQRPDPRVQVSASLGPLRSAKR